MTIKTLDLDYLKRIAERVKQERENPKVVPISPAPVVPKITRSKKDYWTIPNVNMGPIVGNVDVLKILLDNGASKTPHQWIKYSALSRPTGNFYTPDLPLIYNTLEMAFNLRNYAQYQNDMEEMRKTIKGFSRTNWMNLATLTKIGYGRSGDLDQITHNARLTNESYSFLNFVGDNGTIPAESDISVYQELLETKDDINQIKNVFNWLNDTRSVEIRRLKSRQNFNHEVLATFRCDLNNVILSCDRDINESYLSLGMRFVPTGY